MITTQTGKTTMHIMRSYQCEGNAERWNPPTKDYPFATLDTELKLGWRDWMWTIGIFGGALVAVIPWIVGVVSIVRWVR